MRTSKKYFWKGGSFFKLLDWIPKELLNPIYLSLNPNAIDLLSTPEYKNAINWPNLSSNPSAINLLTANPDKIKWSFLSANPSAINLLTANPEQINWEYLSANPSAIDLLTENPEQINWNSLCSNINAMNLIKEKIYENEGFQNFDVLNWEYLSANPSIFEDLEILVK